MCVVARVWSRPCAPCRHGLNGRFAPDEDAAAAILDCAVHYAQSEHGRVPFNDWPQGVKGHFITRTPPPGFVAQ